MNKPVEQRIRIVAYTPPTFFKEKISQLFKEIRDTQGNVPLWIRYSTSPTAFSWNLGNNRATHKIHVYGEKSYVEEFLSMLNEGIQTEAKYGSSKGFTILNQNPKVWTESLSADKTTNEKLWPVDLKKSAKKQGFFQDLLSASGVLAGLVAILLAISLLKRRNPRDSGAKITRKKALETAMDCINDFAKRSPILKHEEVSEKGWKFILSDYQVNVNSKGAITTIKNVTHHD